MLPIDHKVCTFCAADKNIVFNEHDYVQDMLYMPVTDVRASEGYVVKSFHELVTLTGLLALRNRKYDLFFRGQIKDYKDNNGRSIIYPSICRPENGQKSIYTLAIVDRYKKLKAVVNRIREQQYRERFEEYYYALIQHYEIMPTPLVDITQSLRVAATFALRNSDTGYLYVIGLPYPQGSISHFIDQNIVLVKLQSVCPANAKRPRYQEGFLVGRLPFTPEKHAADNLAHRLLAKFRLDNRNNNFWPLYFNSIPEELLFPGNDVYLKWIKRFAAYF